MSWPLVQFVDAPTATATVRHDFNDLDGYQTFIPRNGFSFGVPALEGEPDAIDNEFGLRQGLQFLVYVAGYKSDALAVKAAMTRELMRRRNWLKFQLSPNTDPVFIPTYRTMPEATDITFVDSVDDSDDVWSVVVRLNAKPWAQGLEETFDLAMTGTTDSGANRQQAVLPAIKGDVATPLTFTFPTGVGETADGPWFVSLAPQADDTMWRWDAVNAEQAADSDLADSPTPVAPGRYRVLSLMPSATGVPVRFGWAPDGILANTIWNTGARGYLPYHPLDHSGGAAVAVEDLGEVQFVSNPGSTGLFTPKIHVQRTTAGAAADPTLMLITVSDDRIDEDATTMLPTVPSGVSPTGDLWLGDDGTHALIYAHGSTPIIPSGATVLVAHPQHENILTLFSSLVSNTFTATFKYHPLYLDLPSG